MRNEIYDKMVMKALQKIKANPEGVTMSESKIEAFETILNETNTDNLAKYYKNMEEYITVNASAYNGTDADLTGMDPHYILTEKAHFCGEQCNVPTVEQVKDVE